MLRRRLMKNGIPDGFVDLGLPSGTLWAKGNICKDANGKYYIGEETDWGTYVSWGNIDGHNEVEGYDFSQDNYNTTSARYVYTIPSNDADHDICLARLGSPCHLPTRYDLEELYDNTDNEWTTINGVRGCKVMKKLDHSVYVFFPASGYYYDTTLSGRSSLGCYWTSSYHQSRTRYDIVVNSGGLKSYDYRNKYYGLTVRPVISGDGT